MDFENIKNLLGEAYTEDVENAIKALVDEGSTGGAGYVPKAKYDQIKGLYDDLSSKQTEFENWRAEKDILTQKVGEMESAYQQLEQESAAKLQNVKNDYLFEKKLSGFKPRNIRALAALIDKGKLTFKDDNIDGLEEQVEELRKSDSFLFEQEPTGTGVPHNANAFQQSTSPIEDERLRKSFGLEENKK